MDINPQIISLLMDLRRRGIVNTKLLSAFEKIPREYFVSEQFIEQAYEDLPCPIGEGEMMMPPYVVAEMLEALELNDRCKVLEIGTGTGYVSALLSTLARRVYTVEVDETLFKSAAQRFTQLDLHTISSQKGDGLKGWEGQAPFDRILVHGAVSAIPTALKSQLSDTGIMVAVIGESDFDQKLVQITKNQIDGQAPNYTENKIKAVKFLPLKVQEEIVQNGKNRV